MSSRHRTSAFVALVAALCVWAGSANAAQVVAVRVGQHPTFTRVVFELDQPAGYAIERQKDELLITLEASSTPRSLTRATRMVSRVAVQDGRERAVAHVRLAEEPALVKELILANPPRLVFDLVHPDAPAVAREPARESAAPPKPAVETEPERIAAPAPTPAPAPEVVNEEPAPPSEPEPAPQPVPVLSEPSEALAEAGEAVEDAAEPALDAAEAAVDEAAELAAEAGEQAEELADEIADGEEALADESRPILEPEPAPADEDEEDRLAAGGPMGSPSAPTPAPIPEPAATPAAVTPPAGSGGSWGRWAGIAAGVGAVVFLVLLWLRRRSLPNDMDVTALAEADEREGDAEAGGFAMGGEPAEYESAAPAAAAPTSFADPEPAEPEFAAGTGLFDDEPEKESDAMDSSDHGFRGSEEATHMSAGAAGGADIARLVQELERRVAQLETRVDEANDARERLERQVTAQAEELRVQRAAIARTQRALRSMNRGEEEQQATEPAIREPR